MFSNLVRKVFGTANDRIIKQIYQEISLINALEENIKSLTDEQLKAKTPYLKEKLASGATLDEILPESFAVVREASRRVMGMRHYDVQLVGGIILHRGMIAEMKTGEGKTLMSTLPVYLNALAGKGVHVVTVNDYLARRDSEWMGGIYRFLGMEVGCILHELTDIERQQAYACDITYGTNNEYGFDYLRDNMKFSRADMVQRGCNYAIIDEVDSILIDEARTPLIISGPTEDNSKLYYIIDKLIPRLQKSDYEVDEKSKIVTLNEEGNAKIEEILKAENLLDSSASLYDINSISLVHHINQALKAHVLFTKDKDYIVKDYKVIIVDEFTGRMMEGRRYSDGLHQALEAKENVPVENENQTLASITFQNYFRLYDKLAGMTGTAMTEAAEFSDIYNLQVVEVPPNKITKRIDMDDDIYRTEKEKLNAIVEEIKKCYAKGQPVLVGTVSIEKSEVVSKLLKKEKIPHQVLNAKHHEKEAQIIAQAGRAGAVTIATNMAGRGTDIMLGGNAEMLIEEEMEKLNIARVKIDREEVAARIAEEIKLNKQKVIEAGGLYVLGTERHESRRIDNQLRGRSGRQGDPGVSKFFLSLQDDLMRIFGSERIGSMLQRLGLQEGEAITHRLISKTIEKAQYKVEQMHFDIRKNLLKFDDVMNDQRKVIYSRRLDLIDATDVSEELKIMSDQVTEDLVKASIPEDSYAEKWEVDVLTKEIFHIYGIHLPIKDWASEDGITESEILSRVDKAVDSINAEKLSKYGAELMQAAGRKILLITLDQLWKEHLLSLDHLKQGIGLRAYGQKDPLNEYKREAFDLFSKMLNNLDVTVTERMSHIEFSTDVTTEDLDLTGHKISDNMVENRDQILGEQDNLSDVLPIMRRTPADKRDPNNQQTWGRITRNELCPCQSGKKYKQCHGKL